MASVLDVAKGEGRDLYLLQVDISKAYDSVDRSRMADVLTHIGLDSPLFRFISSAASRGEVVVTGP